MTGGCRKMGGNYILIIESNLERVIRLIALSKVIGSLYIIFLFICIIWYNELKEKNGKKLF